MERPSQPETNKVDAGQVANDLERMIAEAGLQESSPRALFTIIKMLRDGDIKSAQLTFGWEGDKLLNQEYGDIVKYLEKNLIQK